MAVSFVNFREYGKQTYWLMVFSFFIRHWFYQCSFNFFAVSIFLYILISKICWTNLDDIS